MTGGPSCQPWWSMDRVFDLACSWMDVDVHSDSEAMRTKALQMGANIVRFAFSGAEN